MQRSGASIQGDSGGLGQGEAVMRHTSGEGDAPPPTPFFNKVIYQTHQV